MTSKTPFSSVKELRDQLVQEKLRTQTAINAGSYLAASMMETNDTTKAHLQSFLDGGPLTLDAIQEDGEPINALNSCSFFREHVEEQDTAFRSALEDSSSQD